MADNFLSFSEVVTHLTEREEQWLEAFLLRRTEDEFEKLTEQEQTAWLEERQVDEVCEWPDFKYSFDKTPDRGMRLWLYADEYGSVDNVATVIQTFLTRFRPHECFCLAWASTCSKLRAGEFGGGALFVTAEGAESICVDDWLIDKHREWESRQKPKP